MLLEQRDVGKKSRAGNETHQQNCHPEGAGPSEGEKRRELELVGISIKSALPGISASKIT